MDHTEEAVGKLVVAGSDRAVDLELAEHSLDAVALLVERSVKRGPASRIEQQIDAVTRLPKASQKAVWQLLDAMIAQHANG